MNKIVIIYLSVLLVSVFGFYSCNSQGTKANIPLTDTTPNARIDSVISETVTLPEIIYIDTEKGEGKGTAHKQEDQTLRFEFDSHGYTHVKALLSSNDPQANIRISQIILPDSTSDGPFSRELEYDLSAPGCYQLIVRENRMAGEPWSGDVTMEIWLSSAVK